MKQGLVERVKKEGGDMDNQNMKEFVGKARTAAWEGTALLYYTRYEVSTWLLDAASLLEIIENDEGILALIADYYDNPQRLPWNSRNRSHDED